MNAIDRRQTPARDRVAGRRVMGRRGSVRRATQRGWPRDGSSRTRAPSAQCHASRSEEQLAGFRRGVAGERPHPRPAAGSARVGQRSANMSNLSGSWLNQRRRPVLGAASLSHSSSAALVVIHQTRRISNRGSRCTGRSPLSIHLEPGRRRLAPFPYGTDDLRSDLPVREEEPDASRRTRWWAHSGGTKTTGI